MNESPKIGYNRTGIQMSPQQSEMMEEAVDQLSLNIPTGGITASEFRQSYIEEAEDLGTVPLPATVKGAANTTFEKLTGRHPEVLIDKLSERLAFERTGVRMYDALVTKCEMEFPQESIDILLRFRAEEARHYEMVRDLMIRMGADPTAITPSADASGVQAMGFLQVLNDPRTTITQCLQAVLGAELIDGDAWSVLIKLLDHADYTQDARHMEVAQLQEQQHLELIRRWHEEFLLRHGKVNLQ